MAVIAQKSFARGEIAPTLYGRSDVAAWQSGVKTCRNWMVEKHGSLANRQGFQFIGATKGAVNPGTGTTFARLVPSIRDITTTYALEMGYHYARVWKGGLPVSVAGSPAYNANVYAAAGTVWTSGGQLWYCIAENINTTAITMALSGGGPTYTLTSSVAAFYIGSIGAWYAIHYPTAIVVFTVTGFTDTQHVTGTIVGTLPVSYAGVATTAWSTAYGPVAGAFWYQLPSTQLEFPLPYADQDLQAIQITQSVDVLTLCHPGYPTQEIKRYSDTQWTVTPVVTSTPLPAPTGGIVLPGLPVSGGSPAAPGGVGVSGGNSGLGAAVWEVTALTANAESNVSSSVVGFGADFTHPATVSWSAVGGAIAYAVYRQIPSSGGLFTLVGVTVNTQFADYGSAIAPALRSPPGASSVAGTFYAYQVTSVDANGIQSGPSASFSCFGQTAWLTNSPPGQPANTLSWTPVPGAVSYNVYRERVAGSGVFGFIGSSSTMNGFNDNAITPDTTVQPPNTRSLFNSATNYPATSVYYQQRYCFANTLSNPETVWMSRTADFYDFASHYPGVDADAVIFQVNGYRINPIRHMVNVRQLLLFTDNGIYSVQGNGAGAVTPANIGDQQENYLGCSAILRPLVVGNSAIYVAVRGNVMRDVRFDLYTNGYNGSNIGLYSQHLLDGFSLISWTFSEVPNSTVWSVRSDGALLGVTYIPDPQALIIGWHRHDTANGLFNDVVTLPESTPNGGQQDMVYAIVSRVINGVSVRYIERMASRMIVDAKSDPQFLDCSTQYDGRNTGTGTLVITGGTTWAITNLLTLTSSTGSFTSGSVGAVYVLRDAAGDLVRFTVSAYLNATTVQGYADEPVPVGLQGVAVTTWSLAITSIAMPQLAGQQVSVLGDGNVLAWPDPSGAQTTLVVPLSGVLPLPVPCEVVTAGLPIAADVVTLDPETPQPGQTFIEKTRTVQKVTLKVDATAGILVGEDFVSMEQVDLNTLPGMDQTTGLFTGTIPYEMRSSYGLNGSVCVRQGRPLPARLLNIAATVSFGDGE